MKKLIPLIIVALFMASCGVQRRYPKYSSKSCHWDTGTYWAEMQKKHKR